MNKEEIEALRKELGLGATGNFPDGKISEDDEGELKFAVLTRNENIMIIFGKPVGWLDLPKDTAREMARGLLRQIALCEKREDPDFRKNAIGKDLKTYNSGGK
jgi:hypothetical protein